MLKEPDMFQMATRLTAVPGIEAVVLGGSRARGTHHSGSDVDLGLYYDGVVDLPELRRVAGEINDAGDVAVAGPGGWGPWVNGGAWLVVDQTSVDWILRDLRRVREQCDRAVGGEFAFQPQPGHPLGFLDVSYAGEVAVSRVLSDPQGVVAALKQQLHPYPVALRASLIANLWQAEFLVAAASKGVVKSDLAYISMCCSAALMFCAHAWHASAGAWVTNEKGIVPDTASLAIDTRDFAEQATCALSQLADPRDGLTRGISSVREVVRDTQTALTARDQGA